FFVSRAWEALRPRGNEVWKLVRHLAAMEMVQPVLHDIITYLQPMTHKRTTKSIFGKLILASSYYVWLERNNRLFKKSKRYPEELRDVIMVTVRLKLLSFRFKNSGNVNSLLAHWKIPSSLEARKGKLGRIFDLFCVIHLGHVPFEAYYEISWLLMESLERRRLWKGFLYFEIEVVYVEFGCHFEVELECEFTLSSLDVLQGFSFFLQTGLTLILATFDGLDVGLLGDVIGVDDCDDDG
nr:reverse transcriptase domain, reverse transcriptase zinc-binding domain protein [Tanacetum cinerariifolium]